jgi:hypothetical protein
VPGALLPVPSYPAGASPTGSRTAAVAVAVGGVQQYVPVTMVEHQAALQTLILKNQVIFEDPNREDHKKIVLDPNTKKFVPVFCL